jgi:hypothetical protein
MVFSVKGPKTLLASAIASALAEFFEVDPTKIESNLLFDAKIVLNNVQLRPQTSQIQPNTTNTDKEAIVLTTTTGAVKRVAFSWAWSSFGDRSESWIKDATLEISGLKFKTQLSYYETTTSNDQELDPKKKKDELSGLQKESSKKLETIKKEGKLEAYARNQVEQIIDALTLQVKEFEFTLALPDEDGKQGPEIHVGGHSVELRSLGRLTDAQVGGKGALKQKLSFGSFYINVVTSTTAEERFTYPLLSPLSYSAVATRISGKRFSSFGSGMEVVGEPLESSEDGDNGVVFHAGLPQIGVLSELGNILLAPATGDEQQSSSSGEDDGEETNNPAVQMVGLEGGEDALLDLKQGEDTFLALKQELLASSVFQFPIPGISLVLPNETKCTLEGFTANFQTDGTVMNIQGFDGAGILVDAYPLIRTNKGCSPDDTSDTSHWTVDFVASEFSIGDHDHGNTDNAPGTMVAMIRCSPTIVAQVLQGMNQIVEATSHLDYTSGTKEKTPPSKSDEESKWSVNIQKSIKVRLEDESQGAESQDEWIEMDLGATFVTIPFGSGSEVRCEGFKMGPSSFGQMSMDVPPITMSVGQESLHLDGTVAAMIESSTTLQNVQSFLSRFTADAQAQAPAEPSGDRQAMELPICFSIPKIEVDILEAASMHVEMNQIAVSKSTVEIESINAHDSTGTKVSVAGFKTLLGLEDIELQLERVDTLNIPGVVALTQPLLNTMLFYFENGAVGIRFKSFEGMLLPPKSDKDETTSTKSNIVVPFPVNLFFEAFTLTKNKQDKKQKVVIHMENLELDVAPQNGNSGDSSAAEHTKDVKVVLNLGEAENYIMQLRSAKIEGFIDPNHTDEIRKLKVQITEPVKICAGYSAVDWQGMFKRKDTSKSEPIKLPDVCIDTLKLEISADFKVVAQVATEVEFSPFQGDQNTTSNILLDDYLKKVRNQAPGMITNTEVLGVNFVDASVTTYGACALHAGSYGGAIIGLATVVGKFEHAHIHMLSPLHSTTEEKASHYCRDLFCVSSRRRRGFGSTCSREESPQRWCRRNVQTWRFRPWFGILNI